MTQVIDQRRAEDRTPWRFRAAAAVSILAILSVWQLATVSTAISPLLLASPLAVLEWLISNGFESALWRDIVATLWRVIFSFAFSAAIGVPLGMLMGRFKYLERSCRLAVDFSRSIPATALFPLFILFFGPGEGSRVAAAIYGASLIILMNTMSGVQQANVARLRAARAFGASGWRVFWHVLLPEALPSILTGFRLAVSLAFVIVIIIEMFIGTASGLGHRIVDAQMLYEIPEMYATILICGMLGYGMNLFFAVLGNRLTHYGGR